MVVDVFSQSFSSESFSTRPREIGRLGEETPEKTVVCFSGVLSKGIPKEQCLICFSLPTNGFDSFPRSWIHSDEKCGLKIDFSPVIVEIPQTVVELDLAPCWDNDLAGCVRLDCRLES